MLPKRIGIDLGTANVLVYVKGRGIVINEPAVVALANRENTVVAVGSEARNMMGKTPDTISVIRPMKDGVIADYLITEAMLRYFIGKVVGRVNFIRPEVMICIPIGATSVEQRAVRHAAEQAGARRPAQLVPEPLAAAIGARLRRDGGWALIVDYGRDASGPGSSLRAVRGHRGANILDRPGEADLSAHVDFAALAAAAGARVFGPIGQGDFLRRLGIAHRAETLKAAAATSQRAAIDAALARLIAPDQMGTLFRVLAVGDDRSAAPAGFSDTPSDDT